MNNFFLIFPIYLIIANWTPTNLYKQTIIPLNSISGVPFYYDGNDCYVNGFEVDTINNYFFLGGNNPVLSCFHGTHLLFSKNYKEFNANAIYLFKNKLYLFDYKFAKNNLFSINKENGKIIRKYDNIITNKISSFSFTDSSLVIEVFNYHKKINLSTERYFLLFSLEGKFINEIKNIDNLPSILNPSSRSVKYKGKWMQTYVFMKYDLDEKKYIIYLENEVSEILASGNIPDSLFGKSFYGGIIDHTIIRNGILYTLSYNQKNAIITEVPLKVLFNQFK